MPVSIIRDLEQDQLPRPKGVHKRQRYCSSKSAKEAPPHGSGGELVSHLLEREEHASDWGAERNCHTGSA